jgi:hypothetical protein
MSECTTFIEDGFVFPRRPENRAALARIDYRIASYPEFVEFLMRSINNAIELRTWTHRAADDPGIALLQGAALLGDILTFYQQRYANEAFLRTAAWRESIAGLTRLLGYRLAPGVGGRATFAFEVKKLAVEIPLAYPIKADLEEAEQPAEFQTLEALTAYPHLSRFNLYRHRFYGTTIDTFDFKVEIKSIGGTTTQAVVDKLGLKAGDRLMLFDSPPGWLDAGSSMTDTQKTPQILQVKAVTRPLGRTLVELAAPAREIWTLPVTAYRLGRNFRHFGHTAPATFTTNLAELNGTITGAKEVVTSYMRHVYVHDTGNPCKLSSATPDLPANIIPLDQQVNDLVVGSKVLVQLTVQSGDEGEPIDVTVLRTIAGARASTMSFGPVTGPTTLLELDDEIARTDFFDLQADVRSYQVHEVTSSGPISLQPEAYFLTSAFTTGTDALQFYGLHSEVQALADRQLILQKNGADPVLLRCMNQPTDFVLGVAPADEARMWTLSFDQPPLPFLRADFDETTPLVTVFGNVVAADQGKAEAEVALGNGDARARFQTFKLPKSPLTYHISAGATPPHVPEIEIVVNGRTWTLATSFFGRTAEEEIYIVREDAEGASYVQFGDGETGARLPSGIKNVVARYRSGSGAFGPPKAGSTPAGGKRIEGLDKVQLPGIVTGGAQAESGDNARSAAPGKIQSLGRMVSLRDFETEVLTVAGVTSASAAWGLVDDVATLVLHVLLEAGRENEFTAVRDTIQVYGRCRGADRFPVQVLQATLRYVFLDLLYSFDPALQQPDVEAALRSALGLAGDAAAARTGLFGLYRRRLGEREYAQRIEGIVQNVSGIVWCKVSALGMFGTTELDPETIVLPASPRTLNTQLTPASNELLQLHTLHLTLTTAPPPPAGECA